MGPLRLLALATVLAASAGAASAGPCSMQIDLMQARVDAKLASAARSGPTARETVAATDHRQPTPDSIAAAEERLGDLTRPRSEPSSPEWRAPAGPMPKATRPLARRRSPRCRGLSARNCHLCAVSDRDGRRVELKL